MTAPRRVLRRFPPINSTSSTRSTLRITAAVGALALAFAGAFAGAAAAAVLPTFTVAGTVGVPTPLPTGASIRVVSLVWDAGENSWDQGPTSSTVNTTTGGYRFTLPAGTTKYTLGFVPEGLADLATVYDGPGVTGTPDPPTSDVGAGVFTGASGTTNNLGEVDLIAADLIGGTVLSPDGTTPLSNEEIDATDAAGNDYFADTNTQGVYSIAVPQTSAKYTISLEPSDDALDQTYYEQGAPNGTTTSPVLASKVDPGSTGIDFRAKYYGGSIEGDFAGTGVADTYLFKTTGGVVTSSVPVQSNGFNDSGFEFDDVDPGTYAVAFRDDSSGKWITAAPTSTAKCLIPVTVSSTPDSDTDIGEDIKLGSASGAGCASPYAGVTTYHYTGTVANMPSNGRVTAGLYYVDEFGDLQYVDEASVDPATGRYSIPGVLDAGEYVAYFEIDDATSPFLDTWSDGSDASLDPQGDAVTADTDPSPGHADISAKDVSLARAVFLKGSILSKSGDPIPGAEIDVEGASEDSDFEAFANTDTSGDYSVRVAPDTTYILGADAPGHTPIYWKNASDPDDATPITSPTSGSASYDFVLPGTLSSISGVVIKVDDATGDESSIPGLKAVLYKLHKGYWEKVGVQTAMDIGGEGDEFEFPADANKGLSTGSYHIRFKAPSGWVPLAEVVHSSTTDPSGFTETRGPVCYISIPDLKKNDQRFVGAIVDPSDTTTHCSGEAPAPRPATTGSASDWAALVSETAAASTSTPTPTPTPTATPSVTPSASPSTTPSTSPAPTATPAPASSSGSIAWLPWTIGIIVGLAVLVGLGFLIFRARA